MSFPTLNHAKAVLPGSRLGVLATGSPVASERALAACEEIKRRGFEPAIPMDPSAYYGNYEYLFANGSPQARAGALMQLFDDPTVAAVILARGGYGALDLLPLLDFERIGQSRKLLIGCSDGTALLLQNVFKGSIPAIHGPTAASCFADCAIGSDTAAESARSIALLLQMIADPGCRLQLAGDILRDGSGQGRIIAGNLTVLTSLLGTPWDIDYDGAVLMLEEVGEAPFRIHRMLMQLKFGGKLNNLAALVFGRFSRCTAKHGPAVDEVIRRAVSDILDGPRYPVLAGLPFGHWGENVPLPVGCLAKVEGGKFETLESPIAMKA